MLSSSVGNKGKNQSEDVKTIQKIINLRDDLRKALPKLVVDGKYGAKTQAAIDQIQLNFMRTVDGRIDPYGLTIKKNVASCVWEANWDGSSGYRFLWGRASWSVKGEANT